MAKIQIRFNTKYLEASSTELKWRLLVDGIEQLASQIEVQVPSYTSEDVIATGETKWHFTCVGEVRWNGSEAVIYPSKE